MKRMKLYTALAAVALVGMLIVMPAAAEGRQEPAGGRAGVELHSALRKLWEEHIVYTRNFIISALAGLDDTAAVADRLLRNQDDIGSAVAAYYGDAAGRQLAGLLRTHILIAADLVKAAKAGDGAGVNAGEAAWHKNADEIAAFLAGANPAWDPATLRDMLSKHLDYTTTEVVSRLKGDWAADIAAYDLGHEHMLKFSDILADGIVKQFPAQFRK